MPPPSSLPPSLPPPPPPTSLKLTLLGDASTGKTSFRQRWVQPDVPLSGAYRATIGCDFLSRKWEPPEGKGGEGVTLQVWDTAGQERFRSLAPAFYRSSHACVLLYSLTSPLQPHEVASHLASWFDEFRRKCPVGEEGEESGESARMFTWVCVGTKADEVDQRGREGRNRAKVIQEEVERTLERLLPRRNGRRAETAAAAAGAVEEGGGGKEGEEGRASTPKPPTMKVQVLPPPSSSSEHRITKPAAIDPTLSPSEPPIPSSSLAPPPSAAPPSSATSPSSPSPRPSLSPSTSPNPSTSSSSSIPSLLDPPEPLPDLLTSTSPPSPPPHFGTAGAPPAVWVGGPFNEEALDENLGGGGGILGRDLEGLGEEEVEPDHRDDPSEGTAEENYVPEQAKGGNKGGKGPAEGIKASAEEAVAKGGGVGRELGVEGVEREEDEEAEEEEYDYAADGIKHFRRTSAVTGEGIEEVFNYIALRTLSHLRLAALETAQRAAEFEQKRRSSVIRINEHDGRAKRTLGSKLREGCCT